MEPSEVVYTIGGVKVVFPFKAYPSQLSMMNKIINGVQRSQNCLLESPTGSGKSLALLCSAIAWQQHEEEKRRSQAIDMERVCTCSCSKKKSAGQTIYLPDLPVPSVVSKTGGESTAALQNPTAATSYLPCIPKTPVAPVTPASTSKKFEDVPQTPVTPAPADETMHSEDDDFVPNKKRYRTPVSCHSNKRSKLSKGIQYENDENEDSDEPEEVRRNPFTVAHWNEHQPSNPSDPSVEPGINQEGNCACCCHSPQTCCDGKEDRQPKKFPKIYFGTRTHKQIAQIVKELGRTAYKDTDMTILGSREHLCVHPTVSTGPKKNEGCKDLLKRRFGLTCKYYNNVHRIKSQWQLDANGLDTAWDIEDLVRVGKRIKACPYFAVRGLKEEANIVFCPYNYLIDPKIRKSMDIVLKDQIVILDEAHNIEDSSREAASLTVTMEQFEESIAEFDKLIKEKWRVNHCVFMRNLLDNLLKWIVSSATNLYRCDYERESRIWTGVEIVAILHNFNIKPDTIPQIVHHLTALCEESEKDEKHALSSNSASLLEGLFVIFEYLFRDNMRFMKDYKVALLRTISRKPFTTNNGWVSRRKSHQNTFTLSLNFWCMNPAVAFSDLHSIRSIILTSGTLSPMDSFASELGTAFPIQLEANHVIHKSQIFVSTVAFGSSGHSLNASYKSSESYSFQDEVGNLLLQVCRIIPYGVLMFFPSYSMMSKLEERWKNTGLWDKLNELKVVLCEPRGNNKNEFDSLLRQFYDVIKECEQMEQVKVIDDNPVQSGAVFLAVCRGKVSEGMDFTDNNARVVLTIGIPFPNFKDKQVELKRQYNDKYTAEKGLLTGSAWYEIQAYRALNQALGRCIRHKNDWGSLILVDERYGRNPTKYISGLSKWIRNNVRHIKHAGQLLLSLEEFANERKEKQNESLNMSSVAMTPSQQILQPTTCHSPLTSNETVTTPGQKPTSNQIGTTRGQKPTSNETVTTPGQKPTSNETVTTPGQKPTSNQIGTTPGQKPTSNETVTTPGQKPTSNQIGTTPVQKPTFTALQHLLKATEELKTTTQHSLLQPLMPPALPQTPGEMRSFQAPTQDHNPLHFVRPSLRKPRRPHLAAPRRTVIVSTQAVSKMFQVQQFLRGANGQLNDVRQYVKLQPYQSLIKITHNGIDKLGVINLPKPSQNIVNPTQLAPTNQRLLKVTANGLIPASPNTSSGDSGNSDVTIDPNTHNSNGKTIDTLSGTDMNHRKENGTMNPDIDTFGCEEIVVEETVQTVYLQNDEECQSNDDLQKMHPYELCLNNETTYEVVEFPEKTSTESPCDREGSPDLFDTDSLPSRGASPVFGGEKNKEGTELNEEGKNEKCKDELNNKNLTGDANSTLDENSTVDGQLHVQMTHPMSRKKLFRPCTSIESTNNESNSGQNNVDNNEGRAIEDSSESPLITRRSRRRKSESGQGKKTRDILDDLDPASEERVEAVQCFQELCCALHHQLSPNLRGLTMIQLSEVKSTFVKECLSSLKSSLPSNQNSLHPSNHTSLPSRCECPVEHPVTDQHVIYGQLVPDHMTGLSTGQPHVESSGFSYNSYWCEKDGASYQPLFCYECWKQNPETKLIGVKEVQRSNSNNANDVSIILFY